MKRITLTKQQARVLLLNLEQKTEGYTRADLRRLDRRILPAIEDRIADYNNAVEAVIKQATQEMSQAADLRGDLQHIVVSRDCELERLNETLGDLHVNITLEDADFDLVKASMPERGLNANKQARRMSLAIEDALTAAIEVASEEKKELQPSVNGGSGIEELSNVGN